MLGNFFTPKPSPMASLLGQYYDPAEAKRQAISQAMLQAGVGLLSQGPTPYKTSFLGSLAPGLAGAAQGAKEGREGYMRTAFDAYALGSEQQKERKAEEEKAKQERAAQEQKQRFDTWIKNSGMTPAQQLYLQANPGAADNVSDTMFPKAVDPLDRRIKEAQINALNRRGETSQQQAVPSGYRVTPDGNLQAIPGGPADPAIKSNKSDRLSATEAKELWASQDEIPALEGTIAALSRAKELNDKTFTGYTAGIRGKVGSSLPGFPGLDQGAADATREFQQIMSLEAINNMANTLKGATTNFELEEFKKILADPSTPPEIRKRTIDRMMTLAEAMKQTKMQRIESISGGSQAPASSAPSGKATNGVPWEIVE